MCKEMNDTFAVWLFGVITRQASQKFLLIYTFYVCHDYYQNSVYICSVPPGTTGLPPRRSFTLRPVLVKQITETLISGNSFFQVDSTARLIYPPVQNVKDNTQVNFCQPYLVNLINKLKAKVTTWIKATQTREAICEPSFVKDTVSVSPFIFRVNILFRKENCHHQIVAKLSGQRPI